MFQIKVQFLSGTLINAPNLVRVKQVLFLTIEYVEISVSLN